MTDETKSQLTERLQFLKSRLEFLRKPFYVAPLTQDLEIDGAKEHSEDFEFEDAYSEPEEAIKAYIESLLIEEELSTGKRTRIITESEVEQIRERHKNGRTFDLLPQGLITRKEIVPVENKIAFAVSTDTTFVKL